MMTTMQYLLGKLAEESCELGQIALKTQQFGVNERYKPANADNIERCNQEFNDVLAIVFMINAEQARLEASLKPAIWFDKDLVLKKQKKALKYLKYSQELGLTE